MAKQQQTLSEMLAQKAELDRAIQEIQQRERAEAITKVKALMAEFGLTPADIGARSASKPNSQAGVKVPAKYRDPATGNTWSGRGLQPNWLKKALESGRSLSDFLAR